MRISDWSSDVCSSDLAQRGGIPPSLHLIMHGLPNHLLHFPDHMQERYSPNDVEKSSHQNWKARDVYRVTENAKAADGSPQPKFYACQMLPYPNGHLDKKSDA